LKKFKFLLFCCFVVLSLAGIAGFWFNWGTKPKSNIKDQKVKIFVIQKGEATDSIVKKLHKDGFIRSSSAFKLLLYKEGLIGKIQAGDFRLSSTMNAQKIAQELTHGTLDSWITLIEGWRSEEIGSYLVNQGFDIDINYWLSIINHSNFEGFLFPDTYLIPKEASAEAVIKILRDNFDQKIEALVPSIQKSNLDLKEIVILASIVEREAKHEEDLSVVAGILIKRWRNDWPLQVDVSVQYIIGKEENWWPKVKKTDLKVDSSYNTYLYPGLPPAPICNPGFSTIKAVIDSQQSEYWYYLSDKQGQMHYAETLEEHNQNIQKYL